MWTRREVRNLDEDEEVSRTCPLASQYQSPNLARCRLTKDSQQHSQRASFLGDSNFPQSVSTFVKGMKIELYQGLYERFSNLEITFPGDRPVAIKGLETRLIRTFGTTGGFGIFNIYLHRCLLWQRSDKPLKRIAVFHGPTVPSWSWMAYTGGISYLKAPYGSVAWEPNVFCPYGDGVDGSEDQSNTEGEIPKIEAVAWDLTSDAAVLMLGSHQGFKRVILDESASGISHRFAGSPKCVVVGKSKEVVEGQELAHYVLIIGAVTTEDGSSSVWERMGVGVLGATDIALEGSGTNVFIQ